MARIRCRLFHRASPLLLLSVSAADDVTFPFAYPVVNRLCVGGGAQVPSWRHGGGGTRMEAHAKPAGAPDSIRGTPLGTTLLHTSAQCMHGQRCRARSDNGVIVVVVLLSSCSKKLSTGSVPSSAPSLVGVPRQRRKAGASRRCLCRSVCRALRCPSNAGVGFRCEGLAAVTCDSYVQSVPCSLACFQVRLHLVT